MDKQGFPQQLSHPEPLVRDMKTFPERCALPCSVLFGKDEIPGLFLTFPAEDIKYFQINPEQLVAPGLKFRMMNSLQIVYVLEIWVMFGKKYDRILKPHLNPHLPVVLKFLELVVETKMLSFHLYNKGKNELVSGLTMLDEDQYQWALRNCKLAMELQEIEMGPVYPTLSEKLHQDMTKKDRLYRFYEQSSMDYFVKDGGRQAIIGKLPGPL